MKPAGKHRPAYAKIVSWPDIEVRYIDLTALGWELEPMLDLVRFIRQSALHKKLFAFTSMDKLVVTIYDPADIDQEVLHVEYNGFSKRWFFEYRPKPYEPFEARRYFPQELGIEKFLQYIEALRW